MSLEPGIVALILAPEVYLPLRMVGTQFHAAEDGMAAADKAFEVIEADSAAPEGGSTTVVARGADIVFDGLGRDLSWGSRTVSTFRRGIARGDHRAHRSQRLRQVDGSARAARG